MSMDNKSSCHFRLKSQKIIFFSKTKLPSLTHHYRYNWQEFYQCQNEVTIHFITEDLGAAPKKKKVNKRGIIYCGVSPNQNLALIPYPNFQTIQSL
jgi:hypothetical protein